MKGRKSCKNVEFSIQFLLKIPRCGWGQKLRGLLGDIDHHLWDHLWCRSGGLAGLCPQSWRQRSDTLQTQRPRQQSGRPQSAETTKHHEQPSSGHTMETGTHTLTFRALRFRLLTSATDDRNHIFHGPTDETIGVSAPGLLLTSNPVGSSTCRVLISVNVDVCV